jgi:hypothetical protein
MPETGGDFKVSDAALWRISGKECDRGQAAAPVYLRLVSAQNRGGRAAPA